MKSKPIAHTRLVSFFLMLVLLVVRGANADLSNQNYSLHLEIDGAVTLHAEKLQPQLFKPAIAVLSSADDPNLALRPAGLQHVNYNVPTWRSTDASTVARLGTVNSKVSAGDGFDSRILEGDKEGRTVDWFAAGKLDTPKLKSATQDGDRILWRFADTDSYRLTATLIMPAGSEEPKLAIEFVPTKPGYYSVAYLGAPESDISSAKEIWQPLIWTEKRFPNRAYLTAAFHCPVPAPMVSVGEETVGLVVDPKELPFQPLPTFENSRFGVAVRNQAGKAQPIVMAPILGGPESKMHAGSIYHFKIRLMLTPGTCNDALIHVARTLFDFRDERTNTLCSLNQTLENMIDYGLSEYSRFNDDLRGCSYDTDAPGTVKNVSSLHPLSMAIVTDNPEIYQRRAKPIIEFLLSREKFLFAPNPDIKIQNPGWQLLGPCAPISELTALAAISHGQTPLFATDAESLLGKKRTLNLDDEETGASWQDYLALYQGTQKPEYLAKARKLADEYITARVEREQTTFVDPQSKGMFFWSSFAPAFHEMLALYEETGDKKYLDAAHEGARRFCQFIWYCPAVPDEDVTVNQGGAAPEYWYLKKRGVGPIKVPEESVPAWRVSEIGLTSEGSGTSTGHRGVMLACHAPWMLRIAELTGDDFLHDVARWAVVGRYANFPGYHINTARTTVYEKPEYPLRPFNQLTYNSFHFNHIWPQIAMVMDYLVSDVYARSRGQISFPARFAEGYAYLKTQIYGDRAGTVYGEKDAWLWMPKQLLAIDNVQVNYIAARGDQKLYLALANQTREKVVAKVQINPKLVRVEQATSARVWLDNRPGEKVAVKQGAFSVPISANGLTVLAIDGVQIHPTFQDDFTHPGKPLSASSAINLKLGGTHAMLLSMGPKLTHAYVYLQATFKEVSAATLHYRLGTGGAWQTLTDSKYPYEFTVPLAEGDPSMDFWVETKDLNGATSRSEQATLMR